MRAVPRGIPTDQRVLAAAPPVQDAFRSVVPGLPGGVSMKRVDILGMRFDRLLVIRRAYVEFRRTAWVCRCDCGNEIIRTTDRLKTGRNQSCGCLQKEMLSRAAVRRNTVHGHNTTARKSPTWMSWSSMLSRCRKPYHTSYPRYGGRGIKVCDRWLSYPNFLADMGERPVGTSIDRIDVNGNYEPCNCRWATRNEQQRNRTDTKLSDEIVTRIKNDRRAQRVIAAEYGIPRSSVSQIKSGKLWAPL